MDIVSFFAYRCYKIGRVYGLLTEEYYDEAMALAKIRDKQLEAALRLGNFEGIGPLHGIPISIKDHVRFYLRQDFLD